MPLAEREYMKERKPRCWYCAKEVSMVRKYATNGMEYLQCPLCQATLCPSENGWNKHKQFATQ